MVTTTRRSRPAAAILGLVVAVVVSAAACGPRADDDQAAEGAAGASVVREAAARTSELTTGTVRTAISVEVADEGSFPVEVMVVETTFDTGADRSSTTTTFAPDALASVVGEELWSDTAPGAGLPGIDALLGEPLTTVVDGGTVYSQTPAAWLDGEGGGGTVWVRVDETVAGLLGGRGAGPGGDGAIAEADEQVLEYLEAVTEPVVPVGTEVVDGVDTTRYEGEVDLVEAAALAGEDLAADDAGIDPGELRAPFVVWVDADGLVRRVEAVLEGLDRATVVETPPGAAGADELRLTLTMSYADLGQPVAIDLPPDDEVVTMAELFAGMAGGEGLAELGDLFPSVDEEPAGS